MAVAPEVDMRSPHKTWNSDQHAREFDGFRFIPTFSLKALYESFNEVRLLGEVAKDKAGGFSLLEVGCATGELYRYLSARHPKVTYTGCDISQPAIERARSKFPKQASFHLTDGELNTVQEMRADIVFCRDVVHHQADPFAFLEKLYDLCTTGMILRIRTRDSGESVLDPELSCQYIYETWVPFMVLNSDEVVSKLTPLEPAPARIKLVKNYTVLGGVYRRFLPKSCYEESTGTAETALLVEKGAPGHSECKIEQETRKEDPGYSLLGRITRKSIERLLGTGYAGRTWW